MTAGGTPSAPTSGRAIALRAITPREASIYACLVDTYCEPGEGFPAVRDSSAVPFLDEWLARAPAFNRIAFRGLLYLAEIGPALSGYGARLRRLERGRRLEYVLSLDRSPFLPLRALSKLLKVATSLGYYGDAGVLRRIGYDPDAVLERSRELRRREGRP